MRFYGGLTVDEVAKVLDVSTRTVLNDWRTARAWLRARLEDEEVLTMSPNRARLQAAGLMGDKESA